MRVKARKVGNSITLTVPNDYEVSTGEIFEVTLTDDGKIVYEPKKRNMFEGDWFNEDLTQKEMLVEGDIFESEWTE